MALGARWKTLGVKFGAVKVKFEGSHNQLCFFRSHVQDSGSLDWGFEFDSDNYVEGSELSWRPWEFSFWAQKGLLAVLGVQGKSSNRLLELSSLL